MALAAHSRAGADEARAHLSSHCDGHRRRLSLVSNVSVAPLAHHEAGRDDGEIAGRSSPKATAIEAYTALRKVQSVHHWTTAGGLVLTVSGLFPATDASYILCSNSASRAAGFFSNPPERRGWSRRNLLELAGTPDRTPPFRELSFLALKSLVAGLPWNDRDRIPGHVSQTRSCSFIKSCGTGFGTFGRHESRGLEKVHPARPATVSGY